MKEQTARENEQRSNRMIDRDHLMSELGKRQLTSGAGKSETPQRALENAENEVAEKALEIQVQAESRLQSERKAWEQERASLKTTISRLREYRPHQSMTATALREQLDTQQRQYDELLHRFHAAEQSWQAERKGQVRDHLDHQRKFVRESEADRESTHARSDGTTRGQRVGVARSDLGPELL